MDYFEKTSLSELDKLYKREVNARVRTRLLMIINKKKGISYHKIADIFGSSSSTPFSGSGDFVHSVMMAC